MEWKRIYRAFHGVGQAKFAYGGSILKFKPIYYTTPAASKNDAQYKSSQNWLENNNPALLI